MLLDRIRASAAADRAEICGLLLGTGRRITDIAPAANVATDPKRHFELDPAVLIAAHRAARRGGPQVLGHYHSHPSGVAAPSLTDAASAAPDGSVWLIVAQDVMTAWIAGSDGAGGVRFASALLDSR